MREERANGDAARCATQPSRNMFLVSRQQTLAGHHAAAGPAIRGGRTPRQRLPTHGCGNFTSTDPERENRRGGAGPFGRLLATLPGSPTSEASPCNALCVSGIDSYVLCIIVRL
jgi:hypothetical protein